MKGSFFMSTAHAVKTENAITEVAEAPRVKLDFYNLVWIFLACCVIGFCVETAWCFLRHGYIESRKSLVYGPLSVAYGMGGVLLTVVLYKFIDSSNAKIFFISFLAGSVTEYICSWGQETFFGSVAWDYSHLPLNINGRICLLYSLFWGVLGLAWVKLVFPFMGKFLTSSHSTLEITLAWVFVAFFIFDSALSAAAGARMNARQEGIAPRNKIESVLDDRFPDSRMHAIYANSKSVD